MSRAEVQGGNPTTRTSWAWLLGIFETPIPTPIKWPRYRESGSTCENEIQLIERVDSINEWAEREEKQVTFVSGLCATRINPETGQREVLLVRGSSVGEDGVRRPKGFWQFPGGRVKPEDNDDHVQTLDREIDEEIGQNPGNVTYGGTYIPEPEDDSDEVLAIHVFKMDDCPWSEEVLSKEDDVDEAIWTDDPFVDENGEPRVLTAQTDHVLRQEGFEGPANVNTPDPNYDGCPDLKD